MFMEERHQKILEILNQRGRLSSRDIQLQFNVSFDTARRDLRILERNHLLQRTHGGALPLMGNLQTSSLKPTNSKNSGSSDYISTIALKAASIIEKQDIIFINDPQFFDLLLHNLPNDFPLTVFTTSISVAALMTNHANIKAFIGGGEIDNNGNIINLFSQSLIGKMHFDKSFITSSCISSEFGISTNDCYNYSLLNDIIESSKQSIGLYPCEKIGYESILSICPANKLDILITNRHSPNDELVNFDKQGIKLILAEDDSDT